MSIIPNAIYGGIIGDMVGSVYENNPCLKNKVDSFPLWTGRAKLKKKMHESQRAGSRFTDDTVTGLAVAKTLMEIKNFKDDNAVKRAFATEKESFVRAAFSFSEEKFLSFNTEK
jgi:ADP-ribosylglycohydrolase